MFGSSEKRRIYLSEAATRGTPGFVRLKQGTSQLPDPTPGDIIGGIPDAFVREEQSLLPSLWNWGYLGLAVLILGSITLLHDAVAAWLG